MIDRLIYDGNRSKVFHRITADGTAYAVKVLNLEFPTPADIAQFHGEVDTIAGLDLPGLRRAVAKTRENTRHVLIMEWVPGVTLREAFRGKSGDIIDALHIAIAIADVLAGVHDAGIIHKDLTPQNLLVDLQARRVWLIDFGLSTRLTLKQPFTGNADLIEGTLAYISPEQTGRMNRTLDHRSDLYSFGITLYGMLAGAPPFEAPDALELVHAHLAKRPVPLKARVPAVPQVLSDIVARLLAKNADDRYQSARGVRHDLARCLAEFERTGDIAPFRLATRDHTSVFRLPQKLYGRADEVERIVRAFEDSAEGARKLVLVGGQSGVGKTALVQEVHRPITARRGYFCRGKFDQLQRATPYFAVLEAFGDLIDTRLTEDEGRLAALRASLSEALGEEGRVLTNVLPNLEHVIGVQPPVAEVGGAEAQNRFRYVFRKFVRALITAEAPVVIFIDDLQWADSASLDLLQALLTDPESGYLMLVCAYRENEVDPTHPFLRMVDAVTETGLVPERVRVDALSGADLVALLSDALAADADSVVPLARLVHDKTRGNAFFATEFLKMLAGEGLLRFDVGTSRWQWETERIAALSVSDNVVDLLAAKVRQLAPETRLALQGAACLGNRFDGDTLCGIVGVEAATLAGHLHPALAEGLVLPLGGGAFAFSHDRIQQAVYSLIPEAERARVHLDIGRTLKARRAGQGGAVPVFDMVDQLNRGSALMTDRAEILGLAGLNLDAGRQAKLNSAFPTALAYLDRGICLLRDGGGGDPWDDHYDLTLALFTEATEAAYLSGAFDRMELWFRETLDRARGIPDKVRPYEIRILALKAENRFIEAIDTGLEVLAVLGERFPARPNPGHVFADLAVTWAALRGRSNADLMALPRMSDPEKSAAMRIIANITSSVYWGRPNLVPLVVFRMVRLSLRHGNHPVSCFAYGAYGVLMCGVLGAMREGYRYGQLALDLLDLLDAKEWKAQIYVTPYSLINHWNEHVRTTLRPLQQSFEIGMETGLVEFACVNTNIYCIQSFLCGRPLLRVEEETRAYNALYRQFRQETNLNYNEVFRQAMLNLMGRSEDPVRLTGDAYDEAKMLAQTAERSDKTGAFFIHFNKLMLCCLFRRYDEADRHAAAARALLGAVLAKFEIPNHAFYAALTSLALARRARGTARLAHLVRARRDIARLKRWSRTAPQNYRHKYDLCAAELARVTGREGAARLAYDRAIAGASEQDFLHEQALAYELAGRFYAETGRTVLAEFHLKAAYTTYREWGATAKLRDLAETYPKYLATGDAGSSGAATTTIHGASLDLVTVLKASTTISGEVVPSRLLGVLMRIVLENAGATRGLLLLDRNGKGDLRVMAEGVEGGGRLEVMQETPLSAYPDLPVPIVSFVHRTGDTVMISDAATDDRLGAGAPGGVARSGSILCVPILNSGRAVGVLYLENNLTTGAFTRSRVDLLSLLSGQIAVSINNALLYERLEQKVSERTAELEREQQKSDALLRNILPAETADELRRNGHAVARHYDRVTVLFTDFQGFTELCARLTPSELVAEIDACFKAFDLIAERHRVEKIKTIGDAFMAVGGLPVPNSTHAENVVAAALEMRDFMRHRVETGDGRALAVRIGVHTGPVVAGVVGLLKFQYDVWGDTVNIAARMEAAGQAGEVNVSRDTFDLVKDRFDFTFRGNLEAKGKGHLPMYFVDHLHDGAERKRHDGHVQASR